MAVPDRGGNAHATPADPPCLVAAQIANAIPRRGQAAFGMLYSTILEPAPLLQQGLIFQSMSSAMPSDWYQVSRHERFVKIGRLLL